MEVYKLEPANSSDQISLKKLEGEFICRNFCKKPHDLEIITPGPGHSEFLSAKKNSTEQIKLQEITIHDF
jgi:hypothetical protein